MEGDRKARGLDKSLRKYIPPKLKSKELPGTLQVEKATSQPKFQKIRGKCQKHRRGLRTSRNQFGTNSHNRVKAQRKCIAKISTTTADDKGIEKIFNREYKMQPLR